ncbi:hypothetical protein DSO57_1023642 [Entomophthora muscae]|uniref:Uncharacterized protein n=1 Tax=Entomophthora muscae TaxID=34485 RepID=A0ACC2RHK9_9FUNG|nr:hypothetical protein DSO57_1023642 [Entomophthora muscae]
MLKLDLPPNQTPVVEEVITPPMPQTYHLGSERPCGVHTLLQKLFDPTSLCALTTGGHGESTYKAIDNSLSSHKFSPGLPASLAVCVDKNNPCLPVGINLKVACTSLLLCTLGDLPLTPSTLQSLSLSSPLRLPSLPLN